jgi:hypothetical protein
VDLQRLMMIEEEEKKAASTIKQKFQYIHFVKDKLLILLQVIRLKTVLGRKRKKCFIG